jgi:hypothetical protein
VGVERGGGAVEQDRTGRPRRSGRRVHPQAAVGAPGGGAAARVVALVVGPSGGERRAFADLAELETTLPVHSTRVDSLLRGVRRFGHSHPQDRVGVVFVSRTAPLPLQ